MEHQTGPDWADDAAEPGSSPWLAGAAEGSDAAGTPAGRETGDTADSHGDDSFSDRAGELHASTESGRPGSGAVLAEGGPAAVAATPPAPATGEPRVDAALRLLERLPGLPVSDHPELFEQVHAQLSEVLGELDPESAGSGPAGRCRAARTR